MFQKNGDVYLVPFNTGLTPCIKFISPGKKYAALAFGLNSIPCSGKYNSPPS